MFRHKPLGVMILALLLTSLACNAFAGNLQPFPPPPTPVVESSEDLEIFVPTATLAEPPLFPVESARLTVLADLNVRSGPGVQYERVGFILKDESVPVLGLHSPTGWWKIACPETTSATDCWVSGGEQYTQAEYVDDVAEIEAPSTPTPVPPNLDEGFGILAFIDGGNLFAAPLDLDQNPLLLAADPTQLSTVANINRLAVSPDGRRIAFISETPAGDRLYTVNIDGNDLRELLRSPELPLELSQDGTDLVVWIDQLSWLSDNATLVFNTTVTDLSGPGVFSQEDLWTVTLDGELTQIFPSGSGGGAFNLISPHNILLSRSDNIARANMDGTVDEILLQFEPVNTASEYVYYPLPQPTVHGDVLLYIPDAQPWQPGAWTTLWQLSAAGQARQLGVVEGTALFNPLIWSPDGTHLAFVQQSFAQTASAIPQLIIADGRGVNADTYVAADSLLFHGWSPDSARFLYSGAGFYAIGGVNAPPLQTILGTDQHVGAAQWISDLAFIIGVGSLEEGSWELVSVADSTEGVSLATIHGFEPQFEVWLP